MQGADISMETNIDNLKPSMIILDHLDVSTQADMQSLSYDTEDEMMGRIPNKDARTENYNKQDIREQYCISNRGLGALENDKLRFFGCLSSYNISACSNRTSFLTACVRQKAPSDENLYELYKRHPSEYAPYPRRSRNPWGPLAPEIYRYDEDLKTSYFRRKIQTDPSRYTWMTSDDESVKMEKPKSIIESSVNQSTCRSVTSKKHVSFARSYTLSSFDDAILSLNTSTNDLSNTTRRQERLLDVRKTQILPITKQPESDNILIMDKIKRTLTKTQATQTEVGLGRKLIPSNHGTFSPRIVELVSQEAQTNGFNLNGRKLIKSFSESGNKFGVSCGIRNKQYETLLNHEPLQRTHSDEPPRSPFMTHPQFTPTEPLQELFDSDISSLSKSDPESEDSTQSKKEIFIDFKPQIPQDLQKTIKKLTKTLSDGAILVNQRKISNIEEKKSSSVSHENMTEDLIIKFTPYFQKTPIKNEGIYKSLDQNLYSCLNGSMSAQDLADEEFHENLIYSKIYLDREEYIKNNTNVLENPSPYENSVTPFVSVFPEKTSPTTNDSFTDVIREESEKGIWKECESKVLQINSGTDSGTPLINLKLTTDTSPSSTNLLTLASHRNHLLMLQHQPKSSLEEEILDVNAIYPKIIVNKSVTELPSSAARQYMLSQKSHMWNKTLDSPIESPLLSMVPDLLLARTDSCKTNTDISESTTTDDYITANSGTDSSRKSGSVKGIDVNLSIDRNNDGSNFENIKGTVSEDMVVPTLPADGSPNSCSCCNTPVSNTRTGRSTPTEYSSSSCGSYSVGSIPDILERSKVPSRRSGKVDTSSRFLNDSPADHELIWKYSNYDAGYGEEFSLDLSLNQHVYSQTYAIASHEKYKTNSIHLKPVSPSELNRISDKPRSKSRLLTQEKGLKPRKNMYKEEPSYYNKKKEKVTSDNCDMKLYISQTSPRKVKKNKETSRRKSLPRLPVNQRLCDGHCDEKPLSLPGSLSRKKSSKNTNKKGDKENGHFSPIHFPLDTSLKKHSGSCSKLKALSVESLRSVSPGSDSVFYSDPNNHIVDNQMHCLHCGKEVDVITTVDLDNNGIAENRHGIVQPPAEFKDSSRCKTSGRLYKKLGRKIRSEERSSIEIGKHRHKADIRAKSEERGAKTYKNKLRPMTKSTNNSQEQLIATYSSPSILPGAPEDEDDNGIYDVPYLDGHWIHIDERDDINLLNMSYNSITDGTNRKESISSTESEQDFCKRYQAVTHRMVHRKSCIEMYKRQNNQSFDNSSYMLRHIELRLRLEEMFKIMLVIWSQENKALNIIRPLKAECDKIVVVHREAGEFGFRIHGSKPVVVSAIEPGTPAETSGLEVGDIVLSVNGVSVFDKTHSEVVKIAHAGSDTLNLEVVRTSYAFNPPCDTSSNTLYCGYLWKLKGFASGSSNDKWIRRWFCLRDNNCLYYYKTDNDNQPAGVLTIFNHEVKTVASREDSLKPNQFIIQRADEVPLYLAADTSQAQVRWVEVIQKAISDSQIADNFLDETKRNLTLPANAIYQPDCFGYLIKLGTQFKSWSRRYCVLKDACLYFYYTIDAKSAFGLAYLHGYKVQQLLSGSNKYAFEIIPPDSSKKYYYFHTESDIDRKRWIAALEYSIDRWLKVNGNYNS